MKRIIATSTFLISVSLILFNCSRIEEGLEVITWRMNFDLVQTTWDIQFIDAATGNFIGADDETRVEVVIDGPDNQHILDLAGLKQERFYSTKGFLGLILHPDREGNPDTAPVKFIIHARCEGYFPVLVPVITQTSGINPIQVRLVNLDKAPVHVNVFKQDGLSKVIDGQLQDSLILYTPGNQLKLFIPQGVELMDKDNKLLGGSLSIALALWQGTKESAIEAFPGGSFALVNNERFELASKQAACEFYLEIKDQYGKIASNMSKSLTATFLLDSQTFNSEARRTVQPSDVIPVYTPSEDQSIWLRRNSVVIGAFQNKMIAELTLHEGGLFHVGWMNQDFCKFPINLTFNALPEYNQVPYSFKVNVYRDFGGQFQYMQSSIIAGETGSMAEIRNLPSGHEIILRFEAYNPCGTSYYKNPDPILLSGECALQDVIEVGLAPNPPATMKSIAVVFIDTQHNNTHYTPDVFSGYYREVGTTCWQSALVYKGNTFIVNPVEDAEYELGINFKGEFHMKNLTIHEGSNLLVEIEID